MSANKKVMILFLHGMGNESADAFDERTIEFEQAIRDKLPAGIKEQVFVHGLYYQECLQGSESTIWQQMLQETIDWKAAREFILYGFADATGFESRPTEDHSKYQQIQELIKSKLEILYQLNPNQELDLIVFAHSLGCQVMSSYLWDAQAQTPIQGVFKNYQASENVKKEDLIRLKPLKFFYTTGCNIPIFVAGKSPIQAVYSDHPEWGYAFQWYNFYDKDDVLGWPLKPLGALYSDQEVGENYAQAVTEDIQINATGNNLTSNLLSSTPWSHTGYDTQNHLIDHLVKNIRRLF